MLYAAPTFTTPPWTVTRIEDEAIEHSRELGGFVPEEDIEPLTVGIVQRDELGVGGDPTAVHHRPAQVRVAGIRLTVQEARDLAQMLTTASVMIAGPVHRDRWSRNGGFGLAGRDVGLIGVVSA